MSRIFGIEDSTLFNQYVRGKNKAIFPSPLSIVDCFLLLNAFSSVSNAGLPLKLTRLSDSGKHVEYPTLSDAFDLYDIDRDASGIEVVLIDKNSGSSCYWDAHERFVIIAGPEEFIQIARPYPEDIEKHRYVEAMLHLEDEEHPEKPESIYASLKQDRMSFRE